MADRHGGLKRGDQLLSVNGVVICCNIHSYSALIFSHQQSVEGENHEKAVELLKAAHGSVKLVVLYTPNIL